MAQAHYNEGRCVGAIEQASIQATCGATQRLRSSDPTISAHTYGLYVGIADIDDLGIQEPQ